jgi:monooxygenase
MNRPLPETPIEHFDVLIVGAGLSGIGGAYHLKTECPGKSYVILEARDRSGGTWDLFRYPGIRSDSDMYTLGYRFKPWRNAKAIADGPSILDYVRETARENDIDRHIRYRHAVKRASWSSEHSRWMVEALRDGETVRFTCSFIYMCAGYYNYEGGFTPDFPGMQRFRGRIVHPQKWTDDVDYAGKRVVVIGSGATAVTLVPAMTDKAAHVTMLQRSPTYIMTLPARDRIANFLKRVLPIKLAYWLTRWKNVLLTMFFFQMCRRWPAAVKRMIRRGVRNELGPDYDLKHFKPRYNPWDQRLCLVPDSDLFKAIRDDRASIVTDEIEAFTENGIKLKSGAELGADLIVTATGLNLLLGGGVEFAVDGAPVDFSKTYAYKGMMFSGVPNAALAIGYTNASWTLKCDLTSEFVCRLLNHMDRHGYTQCTPRMTNPSLKPEPLIDFSSGYVQRSIDKFPKQGDKAPWRLHQNYALDIMELRFGKLDDGSMEFVGRPSGRRLPDLETAQSP